MRWYARVFALAAAVLVTSSVPRVAEAKCAMSDAVLSPEGGSLPTNPVLWFFLPEADAASLTGMPIVRASYGKKPVPVTITLESRAPAMRAYRVVVAATVAGTLSVEHAAAFASLPRTYAYQIDPAWAPPTTSVAAITTTREASSWSCSHTLTRTLHFPATAWAYRVVAAPSKKALADGKGRSFVFPRSMSQLFEVTPAPGSPAELALGHYNCLGPTFEWPSGPAVVDVFALLPDGSEQKVDAAPLTVAAP